jgi:tetratricopeptide (TPR) repeat protein
MPSRAVVALSLAALAFALYAPVRHHAFVDYDDDRYVLENPNLRLPLGAAALRRAFEPYETNWIPLTWLSLHLDWRLHGPRPAGYLLENAALHAVSAVLLFLALASLTGAAGRSAFVAAVFAAHPLHVESVAWASERKDALSGLFWMLGLLAYSRHATRPGRWRLAPVLASLALGLLAKPSLVTFPFVLWLLDFWPLGRLRLRPGADARARAETRRAIVEKLPMWLLCAAAAVVTFSVQRSRGAMTELHEYPLSLRLMNAAESTLAYVADAFWPSGLAVFYPHPGLAISPGRAGASALVLAAVTLVALRLRRSRPYLAVGWLWFLGTLVPVLGIVQVGLQARADRYTYLPLVGLSIAFAWGAVDLARALRIPRRAVAAAALVAIASLCVATRLQLRHWRDTVALFERAVAVSPDGALPRHHLGLALVNAGRALEARPQLERALALGIDSAEARAGLAIAYEELGHYPEAIEHARAALRIAPGHAFATRELVRILSTCPDPELRDPAEAVRLAEAARDRAGAPDADLLGSLALAYAAAGRRADALRALEHALVRAEMAGDAEAASALRARLVALRAQRAGAPRETRTKEPRGR